MANKPQPAIVRLTNETEETVVDYLHTYGKVKLGNLGVLELTNRSGRWGKDFKGNYIWIPAGRKPRFRPLKKLKNGTSE